MTTTTRNVPAERLERFLGQERREEIQDLALHGLLDDALAAERRATVERIREQFEYEKPSHERDGCHGALRAILDEEAQRSQGSEE